MSCLEKIEKQLESRKLESSKVDDSLQHHVFNSGQRNYFILNIDMRRLDCKDPILCIFKMEQFFGLHHVPTLQKITIASLYLKPDNFVWYQWICDHKKDFIIFCSVFTEELIAHYGDINNNTFFSQLVNLKKQGSVTDNIKQFQ